MPHISNFLFLALGSLDKKTGIVSVRRSILLACPQSNSAANIHDTPMTHISVIVDVLLELVTE